MQSPKQQKWDEQMNLWRIQKLLPAAQLPASTTMPDVTYSREYLRGIPEQLRQQEKQRAWQNAVNQIYQHVVANVTDSARKSKSSYLLEEQYYRPQGTPLTDEDIIGALQEKFPDCIISFQEAWIDTARNTRVLKKGILIDWS